MGRIRDFFRKAAMWLGFGMKGGDDVILRGKGTETGDSQATEQKVSRESVYDALLRGEETEEVKQFRYVMYRVANEANNYVYLGNGVAVKKECKHQDDIQHLKRIVQRNAPEVKPLWAEMDEVKSGTVLKGSELAKETYLFKMEYPDMPRFRLDKYSDEIRVMVEPKEFTLYVSDIPDIERPITRALCNELEKCCSAQGGKGMAMTFLSDGVDRMTFVASNIGYDCYDVNVTLEKMKFSGVSHDEDNGRYVINGCFETIIIDSTDSDFFRNEVMEKKYAEKAPKGTQGASVASFSEEMNKFREL